MRLRCNDFVVFNHIYVMRLDYYIKFNGTINDINLVKIKGN